MSHKKLPMALAAVGAAIVIVAVIAAAAGIFSGQDTKENITDLQASGQERISDTNGYKAMREYYEYLHSLSEEELETVIDTSETAVYEAPAKIKELCEKYQLKYAAKETELLSWDAVETAWTTVPA